jgi:glutathione S-transferase
MLKLYYSPGASSFAAHIVLNELEVPFTLERVMLANGEHHMLEFLTVNPRARVPVLIVEGKPVTELSGILTWLGQQGKDLFPATGTLAAIQCSEWLAWLTSSVHISFAQIWRGERFSGDLEDHIAIRNKGVSALGQQFADIEVKLSRKRYALGNAYSVADPNLLVFYRLGSRVGFDMRKEFPAWTVHAHRLLERPAVKAAIATEGIVIWPEADAWTQDVI